MDSELIQKYLPLVFSAVALLISLFSGSISFLTYRLKVKGEKDSLPSIDVSHLDSLKYLPDKAQSREDHKWSFKVLITNLSKSSNSIVSAKMRFDFVDSDGVSGNLSILASSSDQDDHIKLPTLLSSYETVSGWVSFTLSDEMYQRMQQLNYIVEFEDLGKIRKKIEPKLVLVGD